MVPLDGQGPQRTEEGGECGLRGAAEDADAAPLKGLIHVGSRESMQLSEEARIEKGGMQCPRKVVDT